ncbi:aldo/keto reductase [Neorhizobium alkalisoli]|uniref:Diketogulonate reductase-like aldo/keto reductase n=1 Tax=Neorhizobium alkalisoli TaxID=528178 RepID=A0A561QB16_9HYPH|nr:aldo/keto reductase [Neorhizobium alkalisoli]TWF47549.1 diketogulonate reductase-like aldo/keto reductase [Neorhizobium alkalisoli]
MTGSASVNRLIERIIPSSGESIPLVGCGTWQTFDVGSSPNELEGPSSVIGALVEGGGKLIDSSPMYGQAERVTGEILSRSGLRGKTFLATKVWTRGKESGIDQMSRSFELLKTDIIDLMQVHNLLDWQVHLPTLKEWKAQGRIRYLGVTHYTDSAHSDLEAAIRTGEFDFVQLNYSVADRAAEKRLLPAAKDLGVAVLVNRPFGEGSLIRRLARMPLPDFARELGTQTWPQLALRYVISHPAVTCAIPATSSSEHMRDNMRAASLPELSSAQKSELLAAIG